jgi:multidrug resistance efflux pump
MLSRWSMPIHAGFDGYFEETNLAPIRVGDPALIKLMGHSEIPTRSRRQHRARDQRLECAAEQSEGRDRQSHLHLGAQRIPVRIHLDEVPPGIVLAAGMTATVEIDDRARTAAK